MRAVLNAMMGATLAAALAGCLERKETITVEDDGTVVMELAFNADSQAELYDGDAVPAVAGAWLVETSIEPDDKGRDRFVLRAESVFPPDLELPANYAVPGDPDAELYLQFPTTVAIEDRSDGVYYHFHRLYPARVWAQIETLRRILVVEKTKGLEEKPFEEMTDEERRLVVEAHVDFEAAKMLEFARAEFLKLSPDLPQDMWLGVRASIRRLTGEFDHAKVLQIMAIEDEELREEALEAEAEAWEERSFQALRDALREHCGYGGRRMSMFVAGYEARRRAFDITGDLGDDVFEITVVMPGEIVASNADEAGGDRVTWQLSGRRFRDRDVELMVSSRLAYR